MKINNCIKSSTQRLTFPLSHVGYLVTSYHEESVRFGLKLIEGLKGEYIYILKNN